MKKFKLVGVLVSLLFLSTLSHAQTSVVQSVNNLYNKAQTYRAAIGALGLASAPVEVFYLQGSATKTIYVKSVKISGIATTSASGLQLNMYKRTNAMSNGTTQVMTAVALDSTNGTATAVPRGISANATNTGSGTIIATRRASFLLSTAAVGSQVSSFDFGDWINQYAVLRGTSQYITLSFEGAASLVGGTASIEVEWMEQ